MNSSRRRAPWSLASRRRPLLARQCRRRADRLRACQPARGVDRFVHRGRRKALPRVVHADSGLGALLRGVFRRPGRRNLRRWKAALDVAAAQPGALWRKARPTQPANSIARRSPRRGAPPPSASSYATSTVPICPRTMSPPRPACRSGDGTTTSSQPAPASAGASPHCGSTKRANCWPTKPSCP